MKTQMEFYRRYFSNKTFKMAIDKIARELGYKSGVVPFDDRDEFVKIAKEEMKKK